MKILFSHRGFPGQFKYILTALGALPDTDVRFITANEKDSEITGVKKYNYKVSRNDLGHSSKILKEYDEAIFHGKETAKVATKLKEEGFIPDIIIAHSWGNSLFLKEIFPNTPMLCYFEWYRNPANIDGSTPDEDKRMRVRCDNTASILDLCSCDAGISPTEWQKAQFPIEFQHKIRVIHDGVNTDLCKPNPDATFEFDGKIYSSNDEIITYTTRGMEPMRGFPQFMEAVEKLQKIRPNTHFFIAGLNKVFYGDKSKGLSYKDDMLNKLKLDMSKIHFVGELSFEKYISLLQISSAHVYLTFPFVLSWSLIEALSCGCLIISSKTPPVEEVIKDNENGLLVDFYNSDELAEKLDYALNNQIKLNTLRTNARNKAVEKYEAKKMVNEQYNYICSIIKAWKEQK